MNSFDAGSSFSSLQAHANEMVSSQANRLRQTKLAETSLIQLGILGQANLASEFHSQLAERIRAFEKTLDVTQDVGVQLVTFGQSVTFHVLNFAYCNPSLILFQGQLENGNPVELIQHVSQLCFLLVAMKRAEPDKPKRSVGFHAIGQERNKTTEP